MWAYVKSFFNNGKNNQVEEKQLTLREQSMLLRHNTNVKLIEKGFKWTQAGWSQRRVSHTDWTIKLKNNITLPYIEKKNKNINFISANKIPIVVNNKQLTLQQYIEHHGQQNPNIKIDYNLSSNFNESVEMECVVVLIPKDTSVIHKPCKLSHKYDRLNTNILVVSSQKNSVSLHEEQRKHDIDLEDTMPEIHDKINYNVCLEIPLVRPKNLKGTLLRNIDRNIKGSIVYYLYLDHKELNDDDIDKIEEIFNNFKNDKYMF